MAKVAPRVTKSNKNLTNSSSYKYQQCITQIKYIWLTIQSILMNIHMKKDPPGLV